MQLYTLFQTKERKYFRNSFLNLSNCFCFFTGPKTCKELIDDFKKKYNVDIDMLAGNGEIFLNIMMGSESAKKKFELNIEKLYEDSRKKKIEKNYLLIQVFGNVKDVKIGEKKFDSVSAYIPPIKYYFK